MSAGNVRVNMVNDPFFRSGSIAGWTVASGTAAISLDSARHGKPCLRIDFTAGASATIASPKYTLPSDWGTHNSSLPYKLFTAGSFFIDAPAGSSCDVAVGVRAYDSTGTYRTNTYMVGNKVTTLGAWKDSLVIPTTWSQATQGAARYIDFCVYITSASASATFYVDNCLAECVEGAHYIFFSGMPTTAPTFDGDSADTADYYHGWLGTPHASQSFQVRTQRENVILNPELNAALTNEITYNSSGATVSVSNYHSANDAELVIAAPVGDTIVGFGPLQPYNPNEGWVLNGDIYFPGTSSGSAGFCLLYFDSSRTFIARDPVASLTDSTLHTEYQLPVACVTASSSTYPNAAYIGFGIYITATAAVTYTADTLMMVKADYMAVPLAFFSGSNEEENITVNYFATEPTTGIRSIAAYTGAANASTSLQVAQAGKFGATGSGSAWLGRTANALAPATTGSGASWVNPQNATGSPDGSYASYASTTPNESATLQAGGFAIPPEVVNATSIRGSVVRVNGYTQP